MKKALLALILFCYTVCTYAQCEKKNDAIQWLQSKTSQLVDYVTISSSTIYVGGTNTNYELNWSDVTSAEATNNSTDPSRWAIIRIYATKYKNRTPNFDSWHTIPNDYTIAVKISGDPTMANRVLNALKDIIACNRAGEKY